MSLPSTREKPSQLSIRSFFHTKSSKYTSPPSQAPRPGASITPTVAAPDRPVPIAPTLAPISNLHPQALIRPITAADVPALRRINGLLLPVQYPEAFYQRVLDPNASGLFSRVILWSDPADTESKVVGGVVCRVEDSPSEQNELRHALYIQSLCLLAPYRSLGLATAALDHILVAAASQPNLAVRTAFAHVWTENGEGLRWYQARGFAREGPELKGYYLRLRPDSAWIMRREVVRPDTRALPGRGSETCPPASPISSRSVTAAVANLQSAAPSIENGTCLPLSRTGSYQNQRPDMEWNDLPADMTSGLLLPPRGPGSGENSSASSRSSSMARKKKDRSYPAAAFGS